MVSIDLVGHSAVMELELTPAVIMVFKPLQ